MGALFRICLLFKGNASNFEEMASYPPAVQGTVSEAKECFSVPAGKIFVGGKNAWFRLAGRLFL